MKTRNLRIAAMLGLVLVLVGAAKEWDYAGQSGYLSMSPSKLEARPDGTPLKLLLSGMGRDGALLEGDVHITGECGFINGVAAKTGGRAYLSGGVGNAIYRCDATVETCCVGVQKFVAKLGAYETSAALSLRRDLGRSPSSPTLIDGATNCATGGVFGLERDQRQRFQTFTPPGDGHLTSISVRLRKTQGVDQSAVTLAIHPTNLGLPTDPALASVTIPSSAVLESFSVHTVALPNIPVKGGEPLAVVLGQELPQNACYEWCAAKGITTETFGKLDENGAWVTNAQLDGWLQVFMRAPRAPIVIDGANGCVLGSGFGLESDQRYRFQTFTPDSSGKVVRVWVKLRKVQGKTQSDVSVAIYSTAGGLPTSQLGKTSFIPASSISDAFGIVSIPMSGVEVHAKSQYAVVLGQRIPGYECYEWCDHVNESPLESFGKYSDDTWADESRLGDGWLQVGME